MTVDLHAFANVHSHSSHGPDIITCLPVMTTPDTPQGDAWYSVGLHPWDIPIYIEQATAVTRWLEATAADPRVVAIGECGLDGFHKPVAALDLQERLFLWQAAIATSLSKPLIIHCVGLWHRLLALASSMPPHSLVHGFRGKPELARQLLRAGYDISFGTRYNASSFEATPPQRRHRETD